MAHGDKELLLKDLCARLPYKLCVEDEYGDIVCLDYTDLHFENYFNAILDGNVKPYLFPLSSMTEEQKEDMIKSSCGIGSDKNVFDWYNKNHFDYRGLIPMDLAIDATGKNIY